MDHTIDLWFAIPQTISSPHLLAQYISMLSNEEKKSKDRFHFEQHRHLYLVTRAVEKTLLSRYTGVPVTDLSFEKNEYGKPQLKVDTGLPKLYYNISHTENLIMMAVFQEGEVGVDVEFLRRSIFPEKIASLCFAPLEILDIASQKTWDEKSERFYEYWTLKESYIKAMGKGLAIPLQNIQFDLTHTGRIFHTDKREKFGYWQQFSFKVDSNYLAAVCISAASAYTCSVKMRKIVPLYSETEVQCDIMRHSESLIKCPSGQIPSW